MIKTEYYMTRSDGIVLVRTYSDAGFYIERDGIQYDEAIDPEMLERVYIETDIPIPPLEDPEEEEEVEPDIVIPDVSPIPEENRPLTIQQMREIIIELTSMAAKDDIPQDEYFILHDEVYQATEPIPKGTLIQPEHNCRQTTLQSLITEEKQ